MSRIIPFLLVAFLLGGCASSKDDTRITEDVPEAQETRGKFFGIFGSKREESRSKKVVGRLEMTMTVSPLPVTLSEHRKLTVVLKLSNESKRLVQLDFPTSQRIEILLREADGRIITTWSEDHAFTQAPTVVSINPGERIQYTASISTRDLEPGKLYAVEGFFPDYDELKEQETFVPEA